MAFAAGSATAQTRPVAVDDYVRLHAEGYWYQGRVTALGSDSVTLARGGELRTFALGQVGRADRRVGEHSAWLHGLGVGALIGGIGGAVYGAAIGADCDGNDWFCFNRPTMATVLGIFGAGSGAAVGAIVGAFGKRPSWEPVPLRGERHALRLVPMLSPRFVGMSINVSF